MIFSPTLLKQADRIIGQLAASLLPRSVLRGVPKAPTSILFIRPGGIGDTVLLIPSVQALRKHFPDVPIDILAEQRNAGAFALCPGLRSVYHYDTPSEFISVLRFSYDVIIDTEQWHRLSAVIGRLIRAETRIGFSTNNRRRLLTHSMPYNQEMYERDSFRSLLAPLGADFEAGDDLPFLAVGKEDRNIADSLLAPLTGKRIVTVFPGASIAERRWGAERFAELATRLGGSMEVVVVGGAVDRQDAAIIEQTGALNLAGKTSLAETAAVIARSSLLISGDSGILHIAVGLGIPTVSLFGPGRAKKWAPRGENHIIINKNLSCSPCTTFGYTPRCPSNARCMADITVDEVAEAVFRLLNR